MSFENNLKKFDINLPQAPDPVGAYVAAKIIGNLVFISGQVSFDPVGKLIKGKVGKDLDLKKAQEAAEFCALNLLQPWIDYNYGILVNIEMITIRDMYVFAVFIIASIIVSLLPAIRAYWFSINDGMTIKL